jgi:hypothetical protein
VEMAGGINNFSPMIGNNASQLMKNLQQLIVQNPAYLTSGIPTHLIQQMWKKEPEPPSMLQPKMVNSRIHEVCNLFFFFIYSYQKLY